jgi:nucleoid DNA-binding protein
MVMSIDGRVKGIGHFLYKLRRKRVGKRPKERAEAQTLAAIGAPK